MRAVIYEGTRQVGVHVVDDATLQDQDDVIVRVTSSAICGTDLHMYDGRTGAKPGLVLGHEPLGVVAEAGPGVGLVRPGDRVVIPTHLYCGLCYNCARGYSAVCLRVRPGGFGAAYGYAGMGPYRGAQANLLRVPFANANCIPLPGSPGGDREDYRARPGVIVTHHGKLDDAPHLYRAFDARGEGVIKAVLRP